MKTPSTRGRGFGAEYSWERQSESRQLKRRIAKISLLLPAVMICAATTLPSEYCSASASTVLVSNLGQQPADPSPAFISATVWDAAVFITSNDPILFDSVTLELRGGFPGTFWTTLYSDNNGLPGGPIQNGLLNGPNRPAGG
jgi:hypothetical protein